MRRFNKEALAKLHAKPVEPQDWNSEPHTVVSIREQARIDIMQLETAISGDFRQLPVAYPILARYGLMERTVNGFRSINPETVVSRARELIGKLSHP